MVLLLSFRSPESARSLVPSSMNNKKDAHCERPRSSSRSLGVGRFSFRRSTPATKRKETDSRETNASLSGDDDDAEEPVAAILLEQMSVGQSLTSDSADTADLLSPDPHRCESAVSIFEHSYRLCSCSNAADSTRNRINNNAASRRRISDDPTVKESIEMCFASQLSQGLDLLLNESGDCEDGSGFFTRTASDGGLVVEQLPPSRLLQSRSRTRPKVPSPSSRRRRTAARVVHVGTYNHGRDVSDCTLPLEMVRSKGVQNSVPEPSRCPCAVHATPPPPQCWPQNPLLLRPSRGTNVLGIRFCNSEKYLWKPGDPGTWYTALWKLEHEFSTATVDVGSCGSCCSLPINNGNETEALVTDFVTPLFQGTLLVRIRDATGTTSNSEGPDSYFSGMNRRYQAVVKGRFLKPINLVACQTGFQLQRPCGKLPARWLVSSALKLMSFFAPQLEAVIDSASPSYALTPLGSTPQCLIRCDENHPEVDIEKVLQEPSDERCTLLGSTSGTTSMQRARYRKKHWDKKFQDKLCVPADTSTTYVFEFLQHLFDFHHLQLDLGSLGRVGLQGILNGQPLNILALHESNPLWSFDLWHENLYEDALTHDNAHR